ncbi:hypothetical protein TTHERM_00077040 (macronuclear) [Tetrahymena thermophila SB210]|uniref:Uncharacterized protein n=1 Tax=Tetrahymena thermophila (strain SB210) TaxID=312017 RepID=Q23G60_TETTS|nr:hypothetical protein TTHERM_00077040 [Tetrahymena thermophila SB210]EAR95400.1 hypothetical protein TTHERM_00077040 [Tetrahymena thermophila SB210]|eukprot:XP_001015645.1 hypothetical protein TTHERM_00077040 [Tetrahymena thermophila SB210]
MLKQRDQEKVAKIRENQVQLISSLQKAEQSAELIFSRLVNQNIKQAETIKNINQDVVQIENQVEKMKARIENITSKILNLVEINEQVNREVMNRQAAVVIQKCAIEIEQYQNKKQKDLEDLKQNFSKLA